MYAMLTGNLPFTVEPFNIKSLYNKMMKNEMNPIPEHLSKSMRFLFSNSFVFFLFFCNNLKIDFLLFKLAKIY